MSGIRHYIAVIISLVVMAAPLWAAEGEEKSDPGTIFTFWPLVDYRSSPGDGYSNLSLLGPLFKYQRRKDDRDLAVRPLFYSSANTKDKGASTEYLYPLASTESSPETSRTQVLQLFQKNSFRRDEEGKQEQGTMLFPFYISGKSEKYGPYTSVFPIYGDMYERFWRDEYHYVLFPLYGRTVKNGTTNRNYLYPFFATTEGERESGFQFWPLYGSAAKEGVYRKRFALWPFYLSEESGLDTDNPTRKVYLLPLYAATDSPKVTARYFLWPFIGYKSELDGHQEEKDYFWPFIRTIRGEKRTMDSFLPFYSLDERKESRTRWVMWPLLKHEEIVTDVFRQDLDRVLYFLYSDRLESWPKDGAQRRRSAFWPLYVYKRDTHGVKSISVPAPVEPVLDREGIERSWAPFWRLYQQKWDDRGDSAVSLLWNLYWHEVRGDDSAFEMFPLLSYRSVQKTVDLSLLKGLFRYRSGWGGKSLTFLWLPIGPQWGKAEGVSGATAAGVGEKRP